MKNSFQKIDPEARFAKLVMVMRDMDERELARRCGCALGSVRNLLASTSGSYPELKLKIERVLDCRIWSTPAQFREQQRKH